MLIVRFFYVFMLLSIFAIFIIVPPAFAESIEDFASTAILIAEGSVISAYEDVLEAEKIGGNVSGLFARLNEAGELLAAARMSYKNGDFDDATRLTDLSKNIAEEVKTSAYELKNLAWDDSFQLTRFTILVSISGIILIVLGSLWVWRARAKYRSVFMAGTLILILIAAAPTLGLFIHIPDSSEKFSELWLLGPTRKAEGYPSNVQVSESYLIYVGAGNRLGHSTHYRVYTKLRNQTQPPPTVSNSSPSILPPLYEFDLFIRDNEVWENPLNFKILEALTYNDTMLLKSLVINEFVFQVDTFSVWDEEKSGFYYRLFFELWLYNRTLNSFQYHNRFVGIWLNVTGS